jgi:hypothetical protein
MAIMMILMAWGLPTFANQSRERALYNAGLELQQDLRLAQETAITTRVERSVAFDAAAGTYTFPYRGTTRTRARHSGTTLALTGFTSPLWFDAFGRPCYKDGFGHLVTLAGDVSIAFANAADDKEVTVTVGHVRGRLSLAWTRR